MPKGLFDPPAVVLPDDVGGGVVRFFGDDGRQAELPVNRWPLPGWREPLSRSLAVRVGPAGSIRTRTGVDGIWTTLTHFLDYLAALPTAPADPARLRVEHLTAFEAHLRSRSATTQRSMGFVIQRLASVLLVPPVAELLAEDVRDQLDIRRPGLSPGPGSGGSGYSDGELRRLTIRLRHDVATIVERVRVGQRLAERYSRDPAEIPPGEREHARRLAEIATTGVVPELGDLAAIPRIQTRLQLARQLFLVPADLVPISALFIVLSDRNIETIKELPVACRVLEERAVEVVLTKRRRGAGRWFETVHWEIGPPGRELHHPGGLFLLVRELTALSRQFSGAERLWAIWRNGWHQARVHGVNEHYDPYAKRLHGPASVGTWSDSQEGLWADPSSDGHRAPLALDCVRLKKSMEVRRTKQMGGHLPSAARSNTYPVLFSSYLSRDATVTAWAEDVVATALVDAEQAAWQAHEDGLARTGGHLRVVSGEPTADQIEKRGLAAPAAARIAAGDRDSSWSACADPDRHPATGQACRPPSLLDCFHCSNCVITRSHLPRLLALLDALSQRRAHLGEERWWRRYGATWLAIRRDIIDGRHFTEAEIDQARTVPTEDALVDLIDNPWEITP
jgi:hypothetical protein